MITDLETLKMKKKILEEIANHYELLLKKGLLTESESKKIFETVRDEIVLAYEAQAFSEKVFAFCEAFPSFGFLKTKLQNLRQELFQKIGQECIENLLEQKPDEWRQLSSELEETQEEKVETWIAKLPTKNRTIFMEKFLNLNVHGA